MGQVFLNGNNPYLELDFNVYPALSVFLSAFTQIIDNNFKIPFYMLIKIWPNVADFASAFLIYKFLKKEGIKTIYASLWTSFFLINPVSLIISAAHGQLDSVAAFLVVLAIYLLKTHPLISALSLGASIAVKAHPLMLLPLFLFATLTKNRIKFILIALSLPLFTLLPFLTSQPIQIIKGLLTYSGISDFGYSALLRGIWFQDNANPNLPITLVNQLLNISKFIVLAGIIALTLLFKKAQNISNSIVIIYLLFTAIYFGIGAQYLSWLIPFAVLCRKKIVIIYSIFAAISLIGFYLYFGPDILLGKSVGSMLPFGNKYMYYYFYGNLLLWLTSLFWLVKEVSAGIHTFRLRINN